MLALIEKGLSRDEAYKVAQRNAAKAWEGQDFQTAVSEDPIVKEKLTPEEVAKAFDIRYHLKHVDETFKRLGLLERKAGSLQWRG
jgi:adenylosuccinate lyase